MRDPTPDRKALEDLWWRRLNDAKLRVDFARNHMNEVHRDYPSGPESDHVFARQQALREENFARAEYNRILGIYTDLTVHGKVPSEDDWPAGD